MKNGYSTILFSLIVTTLVLAGLLTVPILDEFIGNCSGTFFCGAKVKETLDYVGQSDNTAISFGYYLYQRAISGLIVFLVTLVLSIVAHRLYSQGKLS